MVNDAQAEAVYKFIWDYLKTHDALPSRPKIMAELKLKREVVTACVNHLRAMGRLDQTTLLPTGYREWWRENVRVAQHWRWQKITRWRKNIAQAQ